MRWVLRGVAACYLVAFVSLWVQAPGLIGRNGLVPAGATLLRYVDHAATPDVLDATFWEQVTRLPRAPTLLLFAGWLGLTLDEGIAVLCAAGCLVSLAMLAVRRPGPLGFLVAYTLYLSLYTAGGVWLSFQWDILLLEAGVAAAVAAPAFVDDAKSRSGGGGGGMVGPGKWLLRFAAFKLLLMAGAVKLQSGCPTWSALTATEVHFASQCLPGPGAWLATQAPPLLHQAAVAATLWLELPAPFLLLVPIDMVARVGVALQVVLQVAIMATGNYNFFNVLTIVLCAAALPTPAPPPPRLAAGAPAESAMDEFDYDGPAAFLRRRWRAVWTSSLGAALQRLALLAFVAVTAGYMFELRATPLPSPQSGAGGSAPLPFWAAWELRLHPTRASLPALERALDATLLPTIQYTALALLLSYFMWALDEVHSMIPCRRRRAAAFEQLPSLPAVCCAVCCAVPRVCCAIPRRLVHVGCVFGVGCATAALFCLSSVSLLTLRPTLLHDPIVQAVALRAYDATANLHLANSYGLFRRMTGVGTPARDAAGLTVTTVARPELVIEGYWPEVGDAALLASGALRLSPAAVPAANSSSSSGAGAWLEIEFPFKPGDVWRRPPFVAPHQPRLDWQMWFAALGENTDAPWVVHLVDALLGGTPEVYALLDVAAYPVAAALNVSVDVGRGGSRRGIRAATALVPPVAVRVRRYQYDFTRAQGPWGRARHPALQPAAYAPPNDTHAAAAAIPWWQRRAVGDFLPTLTAASPALPNFLQYHGWKRAVVDTTPEGSRAAAWEPVLHGATFPSAAADRTPYVATPSTASRCGTAVPAAARAMAVQYGGLAEVPPPPLWGGVTATVFPDTATPPVIRPAKAVQLADDLMAAARALRTIASAARATAQYHVLHTVVPAVGSALCTGVHVLEALHGSGGGNASAGGGGAASYAVVPRQWVKGGVRHGVLAAPRDGLERLGFPLPTTPAPLVLLPGSAHASGLWVFVIVGVVLAARHLVSGVTYNTAVASVEPEAPAPAAADAAPRRAGARSAQFASLTAGLDDIPDDAVAAAPADATASPSHARRDAAHAPAHRHSHVATAASPAGSSPQQHAGGGVRKRRK